MFLYSIHLFPRYAIWTFKTMLGWSCCWNFDSGWLDLILYFLCLIERINAEFCIKLVRRRCCCKIRCERACLKLRHLQCDNNKLKGWKYGSENWNIFKFIFSSSDFLLYISFFFELVQSKSRSSSKIQQRLLLLLLFFALYSVISHVISDA